MRSPSVFNFAHATTLKEKSMAVSSPVASFAPAKVMLLSRIKLPSCVPTPGCIGLIRHFINVGYRVGRCYREKAKSSK